MKNRMPAVFIGHGSPMNTLTDNRFRQAWVDLASSLPKPKAIVCISAHWESIGVFVTATSAPSTIHDFYGFPSELFRVRYKVPGSPSLAERIVELLHPYKANLEPRRGLDHGAWSVLQPMYPEADIPVVQLSLTCVKPEEWQYELATRLRPLREEGVLILGSGNIVHNLSRWDPNATEPTSWALHFNEHIKTLLKNRDHKSLCEWHKLGIDAELSVPTPEHFLPLLYVAAQQCDDEKVRFITDEVTGSIGMTSVIIG